MLDTTRAERRLARALLSRTLHVRTWPGLQRLGSDYGGWTIPATLVQRCWTCYSAGLGTDASFDLELIARFGVDVYALDPVPAAAQYAHEVEATTSRFHYLPYGLWSADESRDFYPPADPSHVSYSAVNLQRTSAPLQLPCRSIPSLMSDLGHTRLDLLKLDIEGAEGEVISSLIEADVAPAVLCIEFHVAGRIRAMAQRANQLLAWRYCAVARRGYDVTFVRTAGP